MDKHTRPYVCHQSGCEKIRGFTYSGGLLRHEREVHKKYGGPKAPRFCPHRDCKRSTGTGFSRKENLHEHLRRVHRGVGIAEDDNLEEATPQAEEAVPDLQLTELTRKRKKVQESDDNVAGPSAVDTIEDLRAQNKRLKMELAQKDQQLKVLEDIVFRSMHSQMPDRAT